MVAVEKSEFILFALCFAAGVLVFLALPRTGPSPRTQDVKRRIWLAQNYTWLFIGLGGLLVLAALFLYVHKLPSLILKTIEALQDSFANDPLDDEEIRNLSYAFAALAGALTIMATIPFQLIRVWLNERTARTAEQSHVTDQINTAVEGLGSEKTVISSTGEKTSKGKEAIPTTIQQSVPNIEVRIGAIYALERISQDSTRDHVQIMEILAAYLRENSAVDNATSFTGATEHSAPKSGTLVSQDFAKAARALAKSAPLDPTFFENPFWLWGLSLSPAVDTQSALRVAGRRTPEQLEIERADTRYGDLGFRLDLRRTDLQGVDISRLSFRNALLTSAAIDGGDLSFADLDGSDLRWARLRGADLQNATLRQADLYEAELQGADLSYVDFTNAKLHGANLRDADLARSVFLGADLSQADLSGVDASGITISATSDLNGTYLGAAAIREIDLSSRQDVSAEILAKAFADASVILPDGLTAGEGVLSHWSPGVFEPAVFYKAWRSWHRQIGYAARP